LAGRLRRSSTTRIELAPNAVWPVWPHTPVLYELSTVAKEMTRRGIHLPLLIGRHHLESNTRTAVRSHRRTPASNGATRARRLARIGLCRTLVDSEPKTVFARATGCSDKLRTQHRPRSATCGGGHWLARAARESGQRKARQGGDFDEQHIAAPCTGLRTVEPDRRRGASNRLTFFFPRLDLQASSPPRSSDARLNAPRRASCSARRGAAGRVSTEATATGARGSATLGPRADAMTSRSEGRLRFPMLRQHVDHATRSHSLSGRLHRPEGDHGGRVRGTAWSRRWTSLAARFSAEHDYYPTRSFSNSLPRGPRPRPGVRRYLTRRLARVVLGRARCEDDLIPREVPRHPARLRLPCPARTTTPRRERFRPSRRATHRHETQPIVRVSPNRCRLSLYFLYRKARTSGGGKSAATSRHYARRPGMTAAEAERWPSAEPGSQEEATRTAARWP